MTFLSIDWGKSRIGVAISDSKLSVVTPLKVIENRGKAIQDIAKLIDAYQVKRVVMGLPLSLHQGSVKKEWKGFSFYEELKMRVKTPFSWMDERFTTSEGYDMMAVDGVRFKEKRKKIDMVSAALILEKFLYIYKKRKRIVLGITGNIGTGKTYVSEKISDMLEAINIDADKISRDIVMPNEEGWQRISDIFGKEYFDESGKLLRKKLGEYVFKNKDALKKLNDALHPIIEKKIEDELDQYRSKIVVLQLPLLRENKLYYFCDYSLLTSANKNVIIGRVRNRDRVNTPYIENIIKNQEKDLKKKDIFDCVIDTSEGWESYKEILSGFIGKIEKEFELVLNM